MKSRVIHPLLLAAAVGIGLFHTKAQAQTATPSETVRQRTPITRTMAVRWEGDSYLVTDNGGASWQVVSTRDLDNVPPHIAKLVRSAMPGAQEATRTVVSPNPATTGMNFRFSVDEPGRVNLALYDVRGERVLDWSQEMRQTGEHAQTIEVSSLPSGIYLYQITNNGGTIGNGTVTIAR
jgi:hypothetical protein